MLIKLSSVQFSSVVLANTVVYRQTICQSVIVIINAYLNLILIVTSVLWCKQNSSRCH